MGTGKISRRIPNRCSGDDRAKSAEEGDCRKAGASAANDQRCRSGKGAAGKLEPKSIAQAKAQFRSFRRSFNLSAGQAEETRRRLSRVREFSLVDRPTSDRCRFLRV